MRKLDSTVVLERLDSNVSSSCAYLRQETAPETEGQTAGHTNSPGDVERGQKAVITPIGLDVSIRFGRLGVLMAAAVSVLVALTVVFNHGVVIGDFDPTTTDVDAQKKLLDDYNSYTGNVASLFGRPIEIFVALAVHVLLLRVLAASLLRPEISWKIDAVTLVTSAGIGYLISNGLNALNVQPQPPIVTPTISAADLTFVADFGVADALMRSTNLSQTFSERTPRNPITNTVLSNLVLPRVATMPPSCNLDAGSLLLSDLVPEYGFPQRDWQSRLLQEAITPRELRVVVNPSKQTNNSTVNAADLPVNAALAADLFVYSMFAANNLFLWGTASNFIELDDIKKRYPTMGPDTAARVFDLVPPETSALDETKQREWFLRSSAIALMRKLNDTNNISRSDVIMEFSHVDISPSMRFDSLTIELEIDPMYLSKVRSADKATRYNEIDRRNQCGPWPNRCMMTNPNGPIHREDTAFDPPAQVQVFGACVSANGAEEIFFEKVDHDLPDLPYGIDCRRLSNTSLMVMSVGKRFVADAFTQNKSANASGLFDLQGGTVLTNLRRIYSFTVGKLSWDLSNLTAEYHAECTKDHGACHGLRFPLAPAGANRSQQQELIVGVDALPMNLMRLPNPLFKPGLTRLVQLHEPLLEFNDELKKYDSALAADPLLAHNIGNTTWDMNAPKPLSSNCDGFIEDRIQFILNNHLYIEHGLQTAYTAATFFLLQNGVVTDVIKLSGNRTSLNFQQNKLSVELLASIPDQNALLTLGGCGVLVISLFLVILWAGASSKSTTGDRCGGLGHVTTPHVVARVLLDSVHFPPLFLHRRVVGGKGVDKTDDLNNHVVENEPQVAPTVEGFVIDGLTLQPPSAAKAS